MLDQVRTDSSPKATGISYVVGEIILLARVKGCKKRIFAHDDATRRFAELSRER